MSREKAALKRVIAIVIAVLMMSAAMISVLPLFVSAADENEIRICFITQIIHPLVNVVFHVTAGVHKGVIAGVIAECTCSDVFNRGRNSKLL